MPESQDHQKEKFRTSLEEAVRDFGLDPLAEDQIERLVKHYSMLLSWNRRINLTRIIAPREAARLHYAESIYGARFIQDARSILDVGSGAGFPAVPLAVANSSCHITALEANQKKSLFLSEVKQELSLDNMTVARERFEEFDSCAFDIITSRALDRAEQVWAAGLVRIVERQRLLLYCAHNTVSKLFESQDFRFHVETHAIPLAENRIIAIFSRE